MSVATEAESSINVSSKRPNGMNNPLSHTILLGLVSPHCPKLEYEY
jgi:hypothetical protein